MERRIVAIVRYEKPLESVRKAVDLSYGLDHFPSERLNRMRRFKYV
jgi:hypothetical protein